VEEKDGVVKFYLSTKSGEESNIKLRWFLKNSPEYFVWYGQSGVKTNLNININSNKWTGIEYGQNIIYPMSFDKHLLGR
jgi:hypothetical protein